jgi:short-subunit dehydrogenase
VTGASSGIGEATVRLFAHAGADVVLVSDHATNLSRVLDAILATEARAVAAITDLTQPEQIDGLLERLEAQVGPIDTLINNAGVGLGAPILDTEERDLRFVFEVNFFALHLLCRQALKLMVPRRSGTIINVTSAAGRFGSPSVGAYSASKGAVHAYTQALRIEAMAYGIRVGECLPISVRTPFFDNTRGEKYRPAGVVLTPEQVAQSIVRAVGANRVPAEILPYRPVKAVFVFDSLFPGLLARIAGSNYLQEIRNQK